MSSACGLAAPRLAKPPRPRRVRIVPRMQRPPIVRLDEVPFLLRPSDLDRVILNIPDHAADIRGGEQESFPAAVGPNGAAGIARPHFAITVTRTILQILDHLFAKIAVF